MELAAVGVAIAVFNQVSRIAIFPLVSVTTSFVAEEDATYKVISDDLENGEEAEPPRTSDSEMKELLTSKGTSLAKLLIDLSLVYISFALCNVILVHVIEKGDIREKSQ